MTLSVPEASEFRNVQEAYDTVAQDYATYLPDTRAEAPIDLAMVDAFVAEATTTQDAPILDAGCGAGRMSRYLADRGCLVQGLDLSPGMVKMARRDHRDLGFTVGSLTDLPYPDDSFGGVLVWYSIIHIPRARLPRTFKEVARVLRPGGHALVGFQSGDGTRDLAGVYRKLGHEVHLERYLYTPDYVGSLMRAAGLTERCRLVRRAEGLETEDQAILLARAELAGNRHPATGGS